MSVTLSEPVVAPPAALPPCLRLLPAPCSEPPYDDELPFQPAPRLLSSPLDVPAPAAPRLRLVADAQPDEDLDEPRPRTTSAALPAPRAFAHALVLRVVEIRAGLRPFTQLQRDTTPELFQDLEERLLALPRATGARPGRADICSLHVQQRPEGVAEVCATVRRGSRVRAFALRLEGQRGRWVCTDLSWV